MVLDPDERIYSVLAEGTKRLEVTLQPCEARVGPEDLRSQRYLLAFAAFPNNPIFQSEGLQSGFPRLVVMAPASSKRKVMDVVGSGVFGLLTKPFQPEEACLLVRRALEIQRIQRELNHLRSLANLAEALMDQLRHMVQKADPTKKGDLFGFVRRCIEKPLLEMALEETGKNRGKAANILGINRNTLRAKMKELSTEQRR